MIIENSMIDEGVLEEVGHRVAGQRVAQGITQADLARNAGIGKRTLERLESGESVQLVSLIRVLRALGLLQSMEVLLPEQEVRPMDLLKLKGKTRQRASKARGLEEKRAEWSWGDE